MEREQMAKKKGDAKQKGTKDAKEAKQKSPFLPGSSLEMLQNYSPCADCAKALIKFAKKHPNLTINIRFIKLYKNESWNEEGRANREGIKKLKACENINLGALTHNDCAKLFGNAAIDSNTEQKLNALR